MALEVGEVLEGKVTGIAKFGAFVALPEGKSGLVHISEVADSFVSDVHEHVQVGQTVRVRVLAVGQDGRINLSIKRAQEAAEQPRQGERRPGAGRPPQSRPAVVQPQRTQADGPSGDRDFEDRLKKFMQESDSRIADTRRHAEQKTRHRRR